MPHPYLHKLPLHPSRSGVMILVLLIAPVISGLTAQITSIRPFQRIKALVVGISDYQHAQVDDLPFADDDALYFAQMLQEQTEWPVATEDIVLLTDQEATFGKFMAELNKLTENARPRDRIIIFFAGHGDVEVVSDRNTGYLLFHDVSPTAYAAGGACEVNVLDKAINELILEKRAQVIFIADACRSGSLAGGGTAGQAATASVITTLFNNTVKILSCEPDELSREDPNLGGGHGLFSYYLVQGMLGAANADSDPFVSLFELERYLQNEVRAASDNRQTPNIKGPNALKLTKARRDNPAINTPLAQFAQANQRPVPDRNSAAAEKFLAFNTAVSANHLLFPVQGSAYQIYQSLDDSPEALAFGQAMKTILITKLQADAQRAIAEYLTSPGKELSKRWVDSEVYANYPAYLETAADLLGKEDYFYPEVMARAHYFRGVNYRLEAELVTKDSSLFQLAMIEQERALAYLPVGSAPHVHNEIGLILRRLGQKEAELAAFQKAHEQSPRWGLALTNLAYSQKRLKKYDEAEASYLKATELDPDLFTAYYNLGILYREMGNSEKAILNYKIAITKPNPKPDAFFNLAEIYWAEDIDLEQAATFVQRYVSLVPDDIYGYFVFGGILIDMGKYQQARELLEIAYSVEPKSLYLTRLRAFLATETGDHSQGIKLRQQVLDDYPEEVSNRIWLAQAHLRAGDTATALKEFKILFENGYRDYDEIDPTENFKELLDNPEFQALFKQYFPDKSW